MIHGGKGKMRMHLVQRHDWLQADLRESINYSVRALEEILPY